jgi:cytochrome c-type biogenesis protein CcmF
MVPMVMMMGLGPIARWKQASLPDIWQRVRWALAASVVVALALPLALGLWTPLIALGMWLAAWLIFTTALDLRKRLAGAGNLWQRIKQPSLSYYGMQFAHLGVAMFIIGVTMVKGYETERDVRMEVGDTLEAGGYVFRFEGAREKQGPNYVAAEGRMSVSKNGKLVTELFPEKRQYNASGMPMTEAAIETGLFRDLYVSLGEPIPDSEAWAVRVYIKPFVDWIWAGCLFMALGGILAISDRRYRIHARKSKPVSVGGQNTLQEKTA